MLRPRLASRGWPTAAERAGASRRLSPRSCFPAVPSGGRAYASSSPPPAPSALSRGVPITAIRNVGIIAHIDAGKTTTTERMLYYVGHTRAIGNVDSGTTVTDYLDAERARGITIVAASIPMAWRGHRINLIDTPGHVDFTAEVERAIRVLDGAVVVVEAVAGVEAQTLTVWDQANRFGVPRLVFVNKMDRDGASLPRALASMQQRLRGWGVPLLLQHPIHAPLHPPAAAEASAAAAASASAPALCGVVDLVRFEAAIWDPAEEAASDRGRLYTQRTVTPQDPWYAAARAARAQLVEQLAEHDDAVTLAQAVFPVLCGASYRNVGVQPVLDAILDYLPSPADRPPIQATLTPEPLNPPGQASVVTVNHGDPQFVGLAFKVQHDAEHGPIVYVRCYAGQLASGAVFYNASLRQKERAMKLLEPYADQFDVLPVLSAGNICAITGTKNVRTGDTLLAAQDMRSLHLESIHMPPPVFQQSIVPVSSLDEKKLDNALEALMREDPSIHVVRDADTGQTLLNGMGELHLEVSTDRLRQVHGVTCELGPVEISYRETFTAPVTEKLSLNRDLFGKVMRADLTITITPRHPAYANAEDLDAHDDSALRSGLLGAVTRGPLVGGCLVQVHVTVDDLTLYDAKKSDLGTCRSIAHRCLKAAMRPPVMAVLQPWSRVHVHVGPAHVGKLTRHLTGAMKAEILEVVEPAAEGAGLATIIAKAPAKGLIGFSTVLRSLTTGVGHFQYEFIGYA
ncbi:hypothetical protein CXG81DRAFT_11946 [Caulochytrium protostelioides]|uniref:Tr-type G domain-containing protein n=1 Tax=Caulochytrium protostelioides TaxID=1555241 RepID=A0A4V1IUR5_9FUNG|nr:hypothetical protein CXG81DRAFT_11946 [Caulochytrium protostelioides]|eukprot:RKP01479.1 hypothetical protein CXG81DRAFT_11946 [Caulochytrium protostelioides]